MIHGFQNTHNNHDIGYCVHKYSYNRYEGIFFQNVVIFSNKSLIISRNDLLAGNIHLFFNYFLLARFIGTISSQSTWFYRNIITSQLCMIYEKSH